MITGGKKALLCSLNVQRKTPQNTKLPTCFKILCGICFHITNLPSIIITTIKPGNLYDFLSYLLYISTPCDFVDENLATVLQKLSKRCMTLECKTNNFTACFPIVRAHPELYDFIKTSFEIVIFIKIYSCELSG